MFYVLILFFTFYIFVDKISDRYLLYALDRYWHNGCLKCHCCGAMLADVGSSCFTRRGLILCKKDYSRYGQCGVM